MRLHATGIALGLSIWLRQSWLVPLVLANAVVGAVYMVLERELLATVGSESLWGTIRLDAFQNLVVNVLFHGVLTAWAVSRTTRRCDDEWAWCKTWAIEALGLALIDVDAVYPTRHGLLPYVVAHLSILASLQVVGPRFFSLPMKKNASTTYKEVATSVSRR